MRRPGESGTAQPGERSPGGRAHTSSRYDGGSARLSARARGSEVRSPAPRRASASMISCRWRPSPPVPSGAEQDTATRPPGEQRLLLARGQPPSRQRSAPTAGAIVPRLAAAAQSSSS